MTDGFTEAEESAIRRRITILPTCSEAECSHNWSIFRRCKRGALRPPDFRTCSRCGRLERL